ncbi:MAG: DNA cytosine methyltransferase [Prevotellaceae bacterium]|nr:DNA cytosine methyltransferase [Candidatus Faecinaster equi]
MSKQIRASITETFGFEPILINSALVSAQNRQRLYWVGIRNEDGTYRRAEIEQPEDREIMLKDILEGNAVPYQKKADVLTASYNGAVIWNSLERHQRSMVAEPINITQDGKSHTVKAQYYKDNIANFVTNGGFGSSGVAEPICVAQRGRNPEHPTSRVAGLPTEQRYEAREDYKTNTLTTVQKDNMVAEPIRVGTMPSPDGELKGGQAMRVYSLDGKAVTLKGNAGGAGAKTGLYAEPVPECFRVKEATKIGYTDIEVGGCVDMSMPNSKTRRGRNMQEKSNCLQTQCSFYQYCGTVIQPIYEVKDGMITVKGKQYPIKLVDGYYIIRKLSVKECMRLQTVPEWYEFPVSNTQAYKMLGNGWTVDVIAHIIKSLLKGE